MARFVPGKWRGGVAHCYPLSFAVKANITVIRGNCGRTNREPAKEGRRRQAAFVRREPDREFSRDERLPGVEYTKRDRTPPRPSFLSSFLPCFCPLCLLSRQPRFVQFEGGRRRTGCGGDKADCSPPPGVKFFPRGCDGGGLMTYQTGKQRESGLFKFFASRYYYAWKIISNNLPTGRGEFDYGSRTGRTLSSFVAQRFFTLPPWNWVSTCFIMVVCVSLLNI